MTEDKIKDLDQAGINLESSRADLMMKLSQARPKTSLISASKEWIGLISLVLGVVTSIYAVLKLNFEYDTYSLKREKERRLTLSSELIQHVNELNSANDTVAMRALTLIVYNSADAIPILLSALERDRRKGMPDNIYSTVNAIIDYNKREESTIVEMICDRYQSVWRISVPEKYNLPLVEKYDNLIRSLSVDATSRKKIVGTLGALKKSINVADHEFELYLHAKLDTLIRTVATLK
ncbi:MAG TPA: hypothetical protein PLX35_08000 [Cyclobacteriaceae bacterium]|nr:hypothetical protein [Cyclobacteriaceae bacterium]